MIARGFPGTPTVNSKGARRPLATIDPQIDRRSRHCIAIGDSSITVGYDDPIANIQGVDVVKARIARYPSARFDILRESPQAGFNATIIGIKQRGSGRLVRS